MDMARFILSSALARTASGISGALKVGVSAIGNIPAGNLQTVLAALKTQVDEKAPWMSGMPSGGQANTVLKKNSAMDYDYSWVAEAAPDVKRACALAASAPTVHDYSAAFTVTEDPPGEANIGIVPASETAQGIVELATSAETTTGTDTTRAAHPAGVAAAIAASAANPRPNVERNNVLVATAPPVLDFSTAFTVTESPAGEVNIGMSGASETAEGVVERATTAEAEAGMDTTRYVSPAGVNAAVNAAVNGRRAVGAFHAYQGTANLNIANNTATKISFQTEEFDVSG